MIPPPPGCCRSYAPLPASSGGIVLVLPATSAALFPAVPPDGRGCVAGSWLPSYGATDAPATHHSQGELYTSSTAHYVVVRTGCYYG